MQPPRVALVHTSPTTVLADYARLFALLGASLPREAVAVRCAAAPVAFPLPGERTEPWQLEAVLALLADAPSRALVQLNSADPADVLAAVAARQRIALAPQSMSDRATIYLGAATPRQAPADGATPRPLLTVLDCTTICRRLALRPPQLESHNLLVASSDPVAAHGVAAALSGARVTVAGYQPTGDTAALAALRRATATPDGQAMNRLAGWRAERLAGIDQQLVYEDWVFHTAWGKLFRSYQRRAVVPGERR